MVFILISHAVVVFDAFHLVDAIISALRYLVFLYILIAYCKHPRLNRYDVLWGLFVVYLLFTTVVKHGSIANVIGPAIDFSLLLMMYHVFRNDMRDMLRASTGALSFYIYLNLVLVILFPDGLWTDPISGRGYFLLGGNYNGIGARCVMALVTNLLIFADSRAAKVNFACLTVASLATVILVGSMTSTVCILGLLAIWAFVQLKRHRLIVLSFFLVYMLAQLIIVFTLSDLTNASHLVDFIEIVLHKDLTFTKRTDLWANSAELIAHSPWLGYGYQNKVWNEEHLNGPGSHNFVYTILLYGGYPLLCLFIGIVITALRKILPLGKERQVSRLILGVNMFFFMMIFEYYTFFIIAFLITLLYYYHQYSPQLVKNNPTHANTLHT